MNTVPLISVIMPSYNAGRFVDDAVASILAQTFPNFELLVFDDGSTDDTRDRLERWRSRDPRVIVHANQHQGLCAVLNAGIACARGIWLARMDADDIALRDRFERQLAWFQSHPLGVAVGGAFEVIDEDGGSVYVHQPATDHATIVEGLYGGYGSQLCHPAVMMARDAVQRCGGYRAEFESAEDVDLFIRLAEIGELGAIAAVLLQYRWHIRSVSHDRQRQQQEVAAEVVVQAWQRKGESMPQRVRDRLTELSRRCGISPTSTDMHEKIIWLARKHGNFATARRHAWRLLRREWRRRRAWRIWMQCWRESPPRAAHTTV